MPFGRSRRWRSGSGAAIAIAAFGAIAVFAGLLAQRFPRRFDLTAQGVQSLSEETRALVGRIDGDVRAVAFPAPDPGMSERVRELLERYHVANPRFRYEVVDPDRNPARAKQYKVTSYNTIVLASGTRTQSVNEPDEQGITNGLRELLSGSTRRVYFTIGHGEHALVGGDRGSYTGAKREIESSGFPVATLNLLTSPSVPSDAAAVIVAGPRKNFLPAEIDALGAYVRGGGSLLALLDPGSDGGLSPLLAGFGVVLDDDLVIDKLSKVFGGDFATPVVMEYGTHPAVAGFKVATFFPEARSVRPADPLPKGVGAETIASTSNQAWGETSKDEIARGQVSFEPGKDRQGPVPLAVAATVPVETKPGAGKAPGNDQGRGAVEGKVIVFGDSDFAGDSAFSLSGNADLFQNVVNSLAMKNPIILSHRTREASPLFLTSQQGGLLAAVSFLLGPGAVLLAGGLVWRERRRHR